MNITKKVETLVMALSHKWYLISGCLITGFLPSTGFLLVVFEAFPKDLSEVNQNREFTPGNRVFPH